MLVNLIVKLMKVENLQVVQVPPKEEDQDKIREKSVTGKLPMLEAHPGLFICDSLPIARYLSRDHPFFLGASHADSKSYLCNFFQ